MTEDEAKTKVCCGPVGIIQALMLANPKLELEVDTIQRLTLCGASACMAWRPVREALHTLDSNQDQQSWRDAGWRIEHRAGGPVAISGGGGFCGLAGRPE